MRRNPSLITTVFTALGFTTIYLLWLIQPGVEPEQRAFYHWSGDPNALFIAIAVDMLGACLLLTLLLLLAQRPGKLRVAIWSGLLLFIPWFVYQNYRLLLYFDVHNRRYSSPLFFGALLATVLLTSYWRPSFAQPFERIVTAASTVLVFAGLFGALLLCKLAWFGWQGHLITQKISLHARQGPAVVQPHRIIWIVFDELSYQQLYEHRFPGLQLPAFDALAKQATVFTDAQPPDIYTQIVLPGLIAGKPFDQIETSSKGQLSVREARSGKWQPFNQHDTVFQDALDANYSTAVAGWYNPYCRVMPGVLDQCFWSFRDHKTNGMIGSESVAYNSLSALHFLSCMVLTAGPKKPLHHTFHCDTFFLDTELMPRSHIRDYADLNAQSKKLLLDRSAGFILLHLPIPHPGGIYDRSTQTLTTSPGSTYIDNLALTDKCLAGLRAVLEQTGQWDSSTILIMGDHSWRTTQVWKPSTLWSDEEQNASLGGKYDPRPAYIVKLPGQTASTLIDSRYSTVNTRALFDQIMAHQITTPAELSAWVQSVH